jgi:hypothetical protein
MTADPRLPSEEVWLLARRSVSTPSEMACYLSNADATTSLATLAHVASRSTRVGVAATKARAGARLQGRLGPILSGALKQDPGPSAAR